MNPEGRRTLTFLLAALLAAVVVGPAADAVGEIDGATAEYLEQKAIEYDEWFQTWHTPHYGPAVNVYFTDETYTEVQSWGGRGDSTIWTGTYLGAEAMRFAVTRDPQARANVIRTVQTLHGHLKVTGFTGYIARFRAPYEPPWWHGCDLDGDCHLGVGEEYENDFWFGNTSRDQYTGWWFGMSLAHDLIDDEPTRQLIREDLVEVLTTLAFYDYMITDETGHPSQVAARVIGPMQLAWHLITARATEDPVFWDWYAERYEEVRTRLAFDSMAFFNKYQEYYGNNLSNQAYFNIFRLENNYRRLAHYVEAYRDQIRPWVGWTHNAFFDLIYLAGCRRIGACEPVDRIMDDVIATLTRMTDAPNLNVFVELSPQPVDPVSVFLSDLGEMIDPEREVLKFKPQSLVPRLWEDRCREDFVWQRSPFDLEGTCGGDVRGVYPGIDYMAAYWMGRFLDLIPPGNPYAEDDPLLPEPNEDAEWWGDDDAPDGDDEDGDEEPFAPDGEDGEEDDDSCGWTG